MQSPVLRSSSPGFELVTSRTGRLHLTLALMAVIFIYFYISNIDLIFTLMGVLLRKEVLQQVLRFSRWSAVESVKLSYQDAGLRFLQPVKDTFEWILIFMEF